MEYPDAEICQVEPDLVPCRDRLGTLDPTRVQNRRSALVDRSDRDGLGCVSLRAAQFAVCIHGSRACREANVTTRPSPIANERSAVRMRRPTRSILARLA